MRKALVVAAFAAALWLAPGALASGWCGSGESAGDLPDANTGPQFHLIYAIPSDGADRFATVANQMADDVTSIDSWWAGQDPTRMLRFDTAVFPACTAVDISFERLPSPSSALANTDVSNAFEAIVAGLNASTLGARPDSEHKDYLVYYDGPPPQPGVVCGTGEGDFDQGGGLAVVWLGACSDVATDAIAAHESLHALGALPFGAPHACTPDQGGSGHPCDSDHDVLYPYSTPGVPLSQLFLDYGHDDYYAHSGTWDDIQDTPFLHRLDVAQVPLAVGIQNQGTVVADEPGLVCAASCTTQWDPGSAVTLTATPAATTRFLGWQGACQGVDTCSLTLAQAESVTAVFGPLTVNVRTSVSGAGRVACTPTCSTRFAAGRTLTLRAVAAKGWRFVHWTGSCKGTRTTCSPPTDANVGAKAVFARVPKKKAKR